MDDLRVGAWVRSERRRAGLRQAELGALAGVSSSTVSRVENGMIGELTMHATRAVAAAVGIRLPFAPRSLRGAAIERHIDWRHAALVEVVVGRLVALGWETTVEYSFNHYGDRGSVDVLAWHSGARALLVVEVKSDLRDIQDTFRALDVKRRVVPRFFEAEKGLRLDSLGIVMALADLRVERQRVERHGSTFAAGLPARTVDVRRWLQRPVGPLRGLWFLQIPRPMGAIQQPKGQGRVRRTSRSREVPSRSLAPGLGGSNSVPDGAAKTQRGPVLGYERAADEEGAGNPE
jgi:transcriptional regulator with XRE-family HTH domain